MAFFSRQSTPPIEAATGQSLERFCRQNIWDVIGATGTTFCPAQRPDLLAKRARLANIGKPESLSGWNPYPTTPKDCLGGIGVWTTRKDFNTHWWIDTTNGISAALYMQTGPVEHPEVVKPLEVLERVLYKDIEQKLGIKQAVRL
ncbi:hypothetical protein ASPWEDRAFT_177532 [Aspergillus wentii DTO 134E9]|uniref:Beta-lactamase-related domain-containing protein n=1 Tax=Aspergillus wentii DTO 134E9 TaxID=1073089 RepID=A0A1L9R4I7_ASPWE|nr:uncharacterized protein ASPWEDRAFT_177532 [Aspergillus wentii DTO 134E9]KAI9927072.1 hypothetical protein MW887_003454 [Aspergillus wentii]OJJ29793.1 hypothetical protein ASPWEDRAFT_177532 [Aspergillus wentii DTO 134E9]